jgi:hypothetical protein
VFNARFILALLILAGAALAACSGNFGAGTSAPGGLLPSGPLSGMTATSSPTPTTASAIVTYGDSAQFQPLPQVAGYGGAIAFEVPSPRPSGFQAVPIGVTLSLGDPADTPDLNLLAAGKKGKHRERPARQLVYITLLATRDITLASYPRLAVDVPRDVVTTYREDEINLALFDAAEKDKAFRLAVEEHDTASPPPLPTPGHTAPPPPTPIPVSAASGASPAGSASPGVGTSPSPGASGAIASPAASPTLPPQRILFAATAHSLKLVANSPVVFAVYALPVATPSPSPSGSGAPAAEGSPAAGGSPAAAGSPQASGSPVAAGSPVATGSPPISSATTSAGGAVGASPAPAGT